MDAKKLVDATNELNELKKELYASKLEQFAAHDAELIDLLKRAAKHDESVLEELAQAMKEEK